MYFKSSYQIQFYFNPLHFMIKTVANYKCEDSYAHSNVIHAFCLLFTSFVVGFCVFVIWNTTRMWLDQALNLFRNQYGNSWVVTIDGTECLRLTEIMFLCHSIMTSQWKVFRLVNNGCFIASNVSALANQMTDYKTVELEWGNGKNRL